MMAWWPLAMLVYPETQARAHAKLDAVVGRARLPAFADYPHLPYIRAVVKEVLRWRPIVPLGMPHRSTEDDWYEGMFIPKGTIRIANAWRMNRDPEVSGAENDGQVSYGAGYASVATWPTTRFSSTSLSCYEHPRSSVRKTHQVSWFPWT